MKTITKISTQKKAGRYNIDLDGKFAFGVAESTIVRFGLEKNKELTDTTIEEILATDKVAVAYNKAIIFLGSRLRSQKQVADKLKNLNYQPDVIQQVIEILVKQKYLDDQQYAQAFLNTQLKTADKGIGNISYQLIQDGIDQQTVEQLVNQVAQASWQEQADRVAKKLSKKNQRQSVNAKRNSIYQSMIGKGFKAGQIEIAIDNLQLENNLDQEQAKLAKLIETKFDHFQKYDSQANYRLKQYLFGKGFMIDDINLALENFLKDK